MSAGEGPDGIVDDASSHRIVLETEAGLAELVYRVNGNRLVLVHTEVPETLRGRGIAGRLVRSAVERAAAGNLVVVPLCPYARTWLEGHPEAAANVEVDWGTKTSGKTRAGSEADFAPAGTDLRVEVKGQAELGKEALRVQKSQEEGHLGDPPL